MNRTTSRTFSLVSFCLPILALASAARAASPAQCAALKSLSLPQTKITSANWMPAGALPEHCVVMGIIGPGSIGFAVQLPSDWNGKLFHQGGGGYVGFIPDASSGLALHYATAATDTGHKGTGPVGGALDATWALNNHQGVIDFGFRAIHVTTATAKEIIDRYYGQRPHRSYFNGCSRGGGQGLMEVQRFPDDFDGVVVGAPAFDWTEFMMGFNWNSRAVQAAPIPASKLHLIAEAVLKQCDASDGLVDGLVQDPRRCQFEPAVLRCQGGDLPTCLTGAQIEAVREVYGGPANSKGRRITPGFPPGSEDGGDGWDLWISGGTANPPWQFTFEDQFFRFIVFNNSAYDSSKFNFDTDPAKLGPTGLILNATDPGLSSFEEHGGKIIMYHGWNDHALSALKTIDYYQQVGRTMGRDDDDNRIQDFFRFFLVPGMHHCGGGPGPNTFDTLTPLAKWVEHGVAPRRIIASGGAVAGRTRPLCPYPTEARYLGHGSIDDAANFVCAGPAAPRDDD
jgi:feruloyl esterase